LAGDARCGRAHGASAESRATPLAPRQRRPPDAAEGEARGLARASHGTNEWEAERGRSMVGLSMSRLWGVASGRWTTGVAFQPRDPDGPIAKQDDGPRELGRTRRDMDDRDAVRRDDDSIGARRDARRPRRRHTAGSADRNLDWFVPLRRVFRQLDAENPVSIGRCRALAQDGVGQGDDALEQTVRTLTDVHAPLRLLA
jgi:hypothetical protein